MADVARRRGLVHLPRLVKEAGSPAQYRLEAAPLPEGAHPDTPAVVPPGGIRYTPQAVSAPAAWLSSALKSGVVRWTIGLPWVFAAGMVVLTLLAVAGIALTVTVGIRTTRPPNLADLIGLLALAGFLAVLLPIYRFFDDLFDLRIVIAPEALTPISQANVTLEIRRPSGDDNSASWHSSGIRPCARNAMELWPSIRGGGISPGDLSVDAGDRAESTSTASIMCFASGPRCAEGPLLRRSAAFAWRSRNSASAAKAYGRPTAANVYTATTRPSRAARRSAGYRDPDSGPRRQTDAAAPRRDSLAAAISRRRSRPAGAQSTSCCKSGSTSTRSKIGRRST